MRREQNKTPFLSLEHLKEHHGGGRATDTLREILFDLRKGSLAEPIKCWQWLVEMMAHHSGWPTDTDADAHCWELVPFAEQRLRRFAEEWNSEVVNARFNRLPFSEPLGDLYNEIGGPTQQQTMDQVHIENLQLLQNQFHIREEARRIGNVPSGMVTMAGTGRFVIHTLVYDDEIQMFLCEEDLWLYRAALVNIRYLAAFTSRIVPTITATGNYATDPSSVATKLQEAGIPLHERRDGTVIVGGRAWAMNADPCIVDMGLPINWEFGVLWWLPSPSWQYSKLIDRRFGFLGSWSEYKKQIGQGMAEIQRKRLHGHDGTVRYDFVMDGVGVDQ